MSIEGGLITSTNKKTVLTTPHPFEQKFGYHRAVRRGPFIAVSGTTALKLLTTKENAADTATLQSEPIPGSSSRVHFPGNAYAQTSYVFETCVAAVTTLGGTKEDVIRVRMFVANSEDCGSVGQAFRDAFGTDGEGDVVSEGRQDMCGVAATMIVVPGGFVDDDILVEIEIEAFVA